MSSHQPPIHMPNQAREDLRREEARKEEFERKTLEDELNQFDAHGFYDTLLLWSMKKVPLPIQKRQHISWMKKSSNQYQPIPVPRAEFPVIRAMSYRAARLLSFLKTLEQKGMNCPYVHQTNKETLEHAIDKCKEIKNAITRIQVNAGLISQFLSFFHRGYLFALDQEVTMLLSRLEAILLICRHEEFAQDLVRLRRTVTYRTGYVLGPDSPEAPKRPFSAATPIQKKKL